MDSKIRLCAAMAGYVMPRYRVSRGHAQASGKFGYSCIPTSLEWHSQHISSQTLIFC